MLERMCMTNLQKIYPKSAKRSGYHIYGDNQHCDQKEYRVVDQVENYFLPQVNWFWYRYIIFAVYSVCIIFHEFLFCI